MVKYAWLNVDKPFNMSSGRVVGRIKKMLGCKVGHAGTLDPLATGVLPIALGEATKTTAYATNTTKSYRVTIQWGEQRDTDDLEGSIIASSDIKPSEDDIRKFLKQYIGNIQQVPSSYSAIKVGGVRAYHLCRQGKSVELAPRNVCILGIELISADQEKNTADMLITCKQGVYIRSLARDLGITLGCMGYVASLRRNRVGPFTEEKAITLESLEAHIENNTLNEVIYPMHVVMEGITHIEVDYTLANMLRNGRSIRLEDVILNGLYIVENYDMCYLSQAGGGPVAVCEVVSGTVRPVRVFNV